MNEDQKGRKDRRKAEWETQGSVGQIRLNPEARLGVFVEWEPCTDGLGALWGWLARDWCRDWACWGASWKDGGWEWDWVRQDLRKFQGQLRAREGGLDGDSPVLRCPSQSSLLPEHKALPRWQLCDVIRRHLSSSEREDWSRGQVKNGWALSCLALCPQEAAFHNSKRIKNIGVRRT